MKELQEATSRVLKHPEKEGIVWRPKDSKYYPGRPPPNGDAIKWHRNVLINGTVLKRHETKTPNVFNYTWGLPAPDLPLLDEYSLDGKKFLVVGKTFSTSKKYEPGDEIKIEAEQVNLIISEDGLDLSAWAPKIVVEEE
jgi:hypothetical protein